MGNGGQVFTPWLAEEKNIPIDNMITDKEYPATHSMSTAWYMVDADGNVGLMDFNENGPVPKLNCVRHEFGLSNLVFGQGFSENDNCGGIHLSVSQIQELLGQPIKPNELWNEACLAIAPEYTAEFLSLCNSKDITNYGCISPDINLFFVDVFDCMDSDDNIIEGSPLDKMIKADMIRAIYKVPELDVDSDYNNDSKSIEFTKNFDNTPYYIYSQPYWTSCPQRRMNIPSNPVKITQIDEEYRGRLLHVPVRFSDSEDLQIAQWFECYADAQRMLIDDAEYTLFPIDKNTGKYCLTGRFLFDFYEYCPDKELYKCAKCDHQCASTDRFTKSPTPTVLYVVDPANKTEVIDRLDLPQEIKDKTALFSYIPYFPYRTPQYWMIIDNVKKYMNVENLTYLLSSSHGWFERLVQTINPHVIIIDNRALPVFTSVFPVANNEVLINDTSYPIFTDTSVKENSKRIIDLAKTPYRGKTFRMTYTEQEVNDLKQQGKAIEYD